MRACGKLKNLPITEGGGHIRKSLIKTVTDTYQEVKEGLEGLASREVGQDAVMQDTPRN